MSIGAIRHVSDIKVTELCDESNKVLRPQTGKNFPFKHTVSIFLLMYFIENNTLIGLNIYATQKGMNIGKQRHVYDIDIEAISHGSQGLLCTQTGMILSASHIYIMKLPLRMRLLYVVYYLHLGNNEHASQQGMNIGSQRHITNIPVEEMDQETETLLPHQAGTIKRYTESCSVTL